MQFLPDDGSLTQNYKTFLLTKLPPYMVPQGYVLVSQLPLTPNGKLDRTTIANILDIQ